jgi:hypothetical protein
MSAGGVKLDFSTGADAIARLGLSDGRGYANSLTGMKLNKYLGG